MVTTPFYLLNEMKIVDVTKNKSWFNKNLLISLHSEVKSSRNSNNLLQKINFHIVNITNGFEKIVLH